MEDGSRQHMIRVASWNIAGGQKSDDAPATYSMDDQEAFVAKEIGRWVQSYGCDVIALQECQSDACEKSLADAFELVGSAEAKESRGFVQLYVRRGMQYEQVAMNGCEPCVALRLRSGDDKTNDEGLVIVATHLPSGPSVSGRRMQILKGAVS